MNPDPFELAIIAAILAHGKSTPPVTFLDQADSLLTAAWWHSNGEDVKLAEEGRRAYLEHVNNEEFSFDKVLAPKQPSDGQKAAQTMLGMIRTQRGLKDAIRRWLKNPEEIIHRGTLFRQEIQDIKRNQEIAYKARLKKAAIGRSKNRSTKS